MSRGPKEPRRITAVRMPKELHERVRQEAANRDVSLNYLMVKAAEAYLKVLPPLGP